jgi:hypothetical protein
MRSTAIYLIGVAAILASCVIVLATDAPAPDTIKADPEVQALLDRYATTPRWTPEFFQQLIALNELRKEKEKEPRRRPGSPPGPPVLKEQRNLICQAAYYFAQRNGPVIEQPNGLIQNNSTGGQFKQLMDELKIGEYRVMAALLPYIDTSDQKLRSFILTQVLEGDGQNITGEKDDKDPVVKGMLDYWAYNVFLGKLETPWTLVQILYWKAPSAAVHHLAKPSPENRTKLYPSVLVVEEALWKKSHGALKPPDVKAAIDELDKLSKFDDWAVKLYVAEMLRRYDQFRDEKIIERLRADKLPLVAKAIDVPFRAEEKQERSLFGL